jgi:hypothetical protein
VELLKVARRIIGSSGLDTRIQGVSKLKRFETPEFPYHDSRAIVQRLFWTTLNGTLEPASITGMFSKRQTFGTTAASGMKDLQRTMAGLRGRFQALGFSAEGLSGVAMSMFELQKYGDDSIGYRIWSSNNFAPIGAIFVIKEDGVYKLPGSEDSLENVGAQVLDLVKANDLAKVRKWLDLVKYGVSEQPGQKSTLIATSTFAGSGNGPDAPAAKYLWPGISDVGRPASLI